MCNIQMGRIEQGKKYETKLNQYRQLMNGAPMLGAISLTSIPTSAVRMQPRACAMDSSSCSERDQNKLFR